MKKLLYFLGALFVLLGLAMVVLVQLVDTDRVKRVMIEQVHERTGRTLVIDGDISWRFFPSLGFTLGQTALLNPDGFAEGATLSIGEASLDVALMPLLDNRIDIGEAVLKNARFHLLTRADGVSNLDDLGALSRPQGQAPTPAGSEQQTPPTSRREPLVISLAGVRVEDAEVILQDERNDSLTRINKVNLQLARFAPGEFVPVSLSGDLFRDEIQAKIDTQGQLRLSPAFDRVQLNELVLNLDASGRALPGNKQLQLTGALDYVLADKTARFSDMQLVLGALDVQGELSVSHAPVPVVRFELATGLLDLDTLMAEWSLVAEEADADAVKPAAPEVSVGHGKEAAAVDLSFLKNLDLFGTLQADKVLIQEMELEQLRLTLKVENGKLRVENAEARLYQGKMEASGELDANKSPVTFRVHKQLEQVDARQLLQAALDIDHLAGSADLTLDLRGRGLDADSIKQSLKGSSQLRIRDGALYGVNIPALLRRGYAQVKGLPLPAEEAVQKTDFSALTADFEVADGVISTDNLEMASPLLRLHGVGQTRLQDSSLDFLLDTAIVGTLKGQDGKALDELKGITVPLRITGTYQQPKYGLDMQQVFDRYLKDKVDKEAERLSEKLGEKLDDKLGDKLKERLPGLLDKLKL